MQHSNTNESLLPASYMIRPRIDEIFEQATRCRLVYVIAGAGYGKTQAVHQYIEQQQDAVVRWVQLTESDNIASHYWENLTHAVSLDNPELALRLRELGFPETLAQLKQFAAIQKSAEHRTLRIFLVLDDCHLIHTPQALTFAERCATLNIPGLCVVLVSRTEPELNVLPLLAKGQVGIITEDELRFTEEEIADFLRWRGVSFSARDLPRFSESTHGWALAIGLLSLVLKRAPKNFDLAFETMRQNIFKLFEAEAFDDFPENVKKKMIQVALISDLPSKLWHEILDDVSFLHDVPQLASFIWFDSFSGNYRVHPLYLEFLQSKQSVLSEKEKQDTYRSAAEWCFENDSYMDAMYYYAKLRQFDRMVAILLSYPFKLPPDTCEYFLNILENLAPAREEPGDVNLLLLENLFIPLLLAGAGRYEEGTERSFDTIREWEDSDSPLAPVFLSAAYSNLAYIDMYTCTVTHQYDSAAHLKKSVDYLKLSAIPSADVSGAFVVADIRSFACLVGEGAQLAEFEEFLETARQTALYVEETDHNMYYGYEDLVACEIAFVKNQPETARICAHRAAVKAREKNQYSIEMTATQYLLRIAVYEGDYPLVKELLKQLRGHLDNPDFWNRQLLYDLFVGFFHAQIRLANLVPAWLVMEEQEINAEVHMPVRELIVSAKSYIASNKYDHALSVLCNSFPREPQERFLFGELVLTLLTAVARVKTGDTAGAVRDLEKAYALSFDGLFEMPFIELGKNLRPLVAAAAKQGGCGVPTDWLATMELKASAYAKKAGVIMNAYKKEQKIEDSVQLSAREREVLNDLYHGLSREEIAVNRYLSINTVKKILQSIYLKLDANNSVDAIRIALENKLLE
ncbi:MAG: LuxR C-terminal-related transcriptional regulator [Oscillospiraceae bacterium]|nr:LuxR C-terminal-related transcriptional regulator [Oscillospiraceae bacterium]